MENVVYVLGAGFSAPWGLPVMSNFLIKSKDMYFENPEKYEDFQKVFEVINIMSKGKNYFTSDLFNIEEILSILEMREHLGDGGIKKNFIQYIIDVIKYYTPSFLPYPAALPGNWQDFVFGSDELARAYGTFISSLFQIEILEKNNQIRRSFWFVREQYPKIKYSVVTLNYDMIIENCYNYINTQYNPETPFEINFDQQFSPNSFNLAKIHGSVDTGQIIPPTWNKVLGQDPPPSWKLAYKALSRANHIRILGYSLPDTDTYVKYLIKSACIDAPHLKSIDVICLDHHGETKKRYDEFITFNNYRYVNGNILGYISKIPKVKYAGRPHENAKFDKLEEWHESFMSDRVN